MLRNANRMVEHALQKLELIADAMKFVRERVEKITGSMGTMTGMIATLVEKLVVGTIAKKMDQHVEKRKKQSKPIPE